MNEWGVVTVIIALVGLVGVFVKAAWSMSKSAQRLSDSVDGLKGSVDELKSENKDDHKVFSDKLDDHEYRITVLEQK